MSKFEYLPDFRPFLEKLHPGLMDGARAAVTETEFPEGKSPESDSFLWEHTVHVAALTYRLCRLEGLDPRLPLIAALFHDAGKLQFRERESDRPEEEGAAQTAEMILAGMRLEPEDIRFITQAIRALYTAESAADSTAAVVHDADFLAKSGHLGIASFFIKNTLRGRNIKHALMEQVSKELTYSKALTGNMRTRAGRKLAVENSRITAEYYQGLLEEMGIHGIDGYRIKEMEIPCPRASHKKAAIVLVLPEICPKCRGLPAPSFSTKKGVKCLKLITRVECGRCGFTYEMAFCLP